MALSFTIIFDPFGRRVFVPAGTTLFQAAFSKGMVLLNKTYETEVRTMARQVTFIDLVSEPGFVEHFLLPPGFRPWIFIDGLKSHG